MKKSVIGAVVIIAFIIIGIFIFTSKNKDVAVINPQYRDIKSKIELSGKVQAKNIYHVTSAQTAKVDYVFVEIGDAVKKGDILYQLDDEGLSDKLKDLEIAMEASSNLADSDILKNAQKGMNYEAFNSAVEKAKAAQTSSSSTQSQLSTQLSQIEQQIEAKKIRSTIDGVVVAVNVKTGETIVSGQHSITVADIEDKYVTAYIMQQDYNNVAEGMEVTLSDDQTGLTLTGTVTYKDYIATETSDSDSVSQYRIEIEPNDTLKNAIGSNITVYITLEERKDTLSLPLTCVQKDESSVYVYIKENNIVKRVNIETGLRDDNYIEILSGINENTEVVSEPSEYMEED